MAHIINRDELPHSGTAHTFEGYLYYDAKVSFFLTNAPPDTGPGGAAQAPYEEVFVMQEGEVTFTVGDDIIEAKGGQIVVVPAGVPLKFVNSGAGRARHIDIHTRSRMVTDWLEESKSSGNESRVGVMKTFAGCFDPDYVANPPPISCSAASITVKCQRVVKTTSREEHPRAGVC